MNNIKETESPLDFKTTFNENGESLVKHYDGFDYPSELTFKCVNSFVYDTGREFEELQYLCIGLINELEKQRR